MRGDIIAKMVRSFMAKYRRSSIIVERSQNSVIETVALERDRHSNRLIGTFDVYSASCTPGSDLGR